MHFKKITVTAIVMIASSIAMAEPAAKAVDLSNFTGVLKKPDIHP